MHVYICFRKGTLWKNEIVKVGSYEKIPDFIIPFHVSFMRLS